MVLVGEDPASQVYVKNKQASTVEVGMNSYEHRLDAATSEADLLALVAKLNADPAVHGILVQLPLPKHINENRVLLAIDPSKDVDAFHPVNVGKLLIGEPDYLPCTPAGIQELLIRSGTEIAGAEVVVNGEELLIMNEDEILAVMP